MVDTRKRRIAVFLFFLLALGLTLIFCRQAEKQFCMGVPILSEKAQSELGRYVKKDMSWDIQFNGQPVAIDLHSSTIYISQHIQPDMKAEDLQGSLRSSPSVQLSFAPDKAFEDLSSAVEQGHVFTLYAQYGSDKYTQYNLIFTTLPVLRIDGEAIDKNEKGKDICEGEMCLWMGKDPETGRYSVKHSDALWNVRGGFTATLDKTSFKVALKKDSGDNRNLSLAGLGADDDWILNPLVLDDTKLKEKLFMSLWNQRAERVDWNYKMSDGEYVEVVINQQYWGIFLLQRRVDRKFLDLEAEDILMKRESYETAPTVQQAFKIVGSNWEEIEIVDLIDAFYHGKDGEILSMDNFLDVNAFIQGAAGLDNYTKNMFLVVEKENDKYQVSLLPWDTDMSWGAVWYDSGFIYDFETSRQAVILREEYDWMRKYHPDLDSQQAKRWFELRESLLTMETVTEILEREQAVLDASGALKRDTDRWGLHYGGEDSLENLYRNVEARFAWVDDYYSQYLQ